MPQKLHFFIVDDDAASVKAYTALLTQAGHDVSAATSSKEALEEIIKVQPDCVLSDLLMPDPDGLKLFQSIRDNDTIKQPTFIIITGKSFEFDRRRSLELGVDGYFVKPINTDTFTDEILHIVNETMTIQFWGCRGTLPVPGKKTLRYGGNTNCVSLSYANNKELFIFDAGTGIKELSNYLMQQNRFPLNAKIFISHPHYDHINGIPFFVPLYMKGNKFEILGTSHENLDVKDLIAGQMDSVYFPITIKEFGADLSFRTLSEENFQINGLEIQTMLLNHPGRCLGFRVLRKKKRFCYVTDNELYLPDSPFYNTHQATRMIDFIKEANLVVMDATYTDEEYAKKVSWGHSSITSVVNIAHQAQVKTLCLYHHDPDQLDTDIDRKLEQAKELLTSLHSKTRCIAAKEGMTIDI